MIFRLDTVGYRLRPNDRQYCTRVARVNERSSTDGPLREVESSWWWKAARQRRLLPSRSTFYVWNVCLVLGFRTAVFFQIFFLDVISVLLRFAMDFATDERLTVIVRAVTEPEKREGLWVCEKRRARKMSYVIPGQSMIMIFAARCQRKDYWLTLYPSLYVSAMRPRHDVP